MYILLPLIQNQEKLMKMHLKWKKKISFDISLSTEGEEEEIPGDIKEIDIIKEQEKIEEEIQTEAPPPPEPETSEPTPTEDTFANFYYL